MNAQMRRIDLLCKLFGPLFIALIDGFSTQVAIIVNFAMNSASVIIEYFAIARVYDDVPRLRERRQKPQDGQSISLARAVPALVWGRIEALLQKSITDFNFYFHHRAFLPSFAGALLYLTVLSFAGQMVTYLLSAGYTSSQIGVARTLSVVFEVLATWVAPWLMGLVGPVRAGLWLSSWQVAMLVAGITVFWAYENKPIISASGLVGGTILSRLGLRGFDLCVQLIVQEVTIFQSCFVLMASLLIMDKDVEAESRGAFSSVEAAWQNAFEILSYASTIIFFHPDQFQWPSLISVAAVASASVLYTIFVYIRRGHLLHLYTLAVFLGSSKGQQRERERVIIRITSETDI